MIRKARFNKNMSQKELGEYIGLSQSSISRIETGKSKALSVQKILDISFALDLNPVEVFIFIAQL